MFKVQRGTVAEGAVETAPVIKGVDVSEDGEAGLCTSGKGTTPEAFAFERGPKALHVGVIIAVGFATHALSDPLLAQ